MQFHLDFPTIASLVDLWNSVSPQVQAAIIAALASIVVSIIAQLWSPIAQRKLEKQKAKLQEELESTKIRLQKELEKELESEKAKAQIDLEKLKSNLAKDLERSRDSITAQNERIAILNEAKKRWRKSDNRIPGTPAELQSEDPANIFRLLTEHGNECREIFNEIKYYLSHDSEQSIEKQLEEISDDLHLLYELSQDSEEYETLSRNIILKYFNFSNALGKAIDEEIRKLLKSRLPAE